MSFDTLDTLPYYAALMPITGGLNATTSNPAFVWGLNAAKHTIAQAKTGKNSGKHYVEINALTNGNGGGDSIGLVSIAGINPSPEGDGFIGGGGGTDYGFSGGGQFGLGYQMFGEVNSGRFWLIGEGPQYTWGTWSLGVMAMAIDLDNNLLWWKFGAGPWVGSTDTGDPAAGTGGYNISTQSGLSGVPGTNRIYPAVSFSQNGSYTFNFGASAFAGSVPSGFNPGWDTTAPAPFMGSALSNALGSVGNSSTFGGAPYACWVTPYVANQSGDLARVVIPASLSASTVAGVIYDDSGAGGGPGQLLGYSGTSSGTTELKCNFLSSVRVVEGAKYYPGFIGTNAFHDNFPWSAGGGSDMWVDATVTNYLAPNPAFVISSTQAIHLGIIAEYAVAPPTGSLVFTGSKPVLIPPPGTGIWTQGHIF